MLLPQVYLDFLRINHRFLYLYLKNISFLFFTNCTSIKYAGNEIETSSVVTVKPKVINESAFENFYMSENLEKELKKIEFTSTSYLRSNKDCIGIVRLSVSGSIDYYQLINTLTENFGMDINNFVKIFLIHYYLNQKKV